MTQTKSLRDIFNSFAAESLQQFPELEGCFLIVDMNEDKIYGLENISLEKTTLTPETARALVEKIQTVQDMREDTSMSSTALQDNTYHLRIIIINNRFDEQSRAALPETTKKNLLNTLDHELAHNVIKNGQDYKTPQEKIMAECIADAYSLLRYYQREGVNAEYDQLPFMLQVRARDLIFYGDTIHFTSFVLNEIDACEYKDLAQLTPAETAERAWSFAQKYAPTPDLVEKIRQNYAPVQTAFNSSKDPAEWLQKLIDVTLDPACDQDTFKATSRWLKHYLEKRTFPNGDPVTLPAEYMDDALQRLKEKVQSFEPSHTHHNKVRPS